MFGDHVTGIDASLAGCYPIYTSTSHGQTVGHNGPPAHMCAMREPNSGHHPSGTLPQIAIQMDQIPWMEYETVKPASPIPVVPIPKIRSGATPSPYLEQKITTTGLITGIERGQRSDKIIGIFLQDPAGDRSRKTSDAIYVNVKDLPETLESQLGLFKPLRVSGKVKQVGPSTVLNASAGAMEVLGDAVPASGRPVPVSLRLPKTSGPREGYLQALDGMMVALPRALVIDPTAHGEFIAVDQAQTGPGAVPGKNPLPMLAVTDRLGFGAQVNTGTTIGGVEGPIKYDDGAVKHWHIMQGKRFTEVDAAGPPASMWGDLDGDGAISAADVSAIQRRAGTQVSGPRDPADLDGNGVVTAGDAQLAQTRAEKVASAGPTFRVASYNMGNMFDSTKDGFPDLETVLTPEQYGTKLARVAGSIRDHLGGPQVIAMQEVENERVLRDLVGRPELKDLGYKFVLLEGEDPRGIDNALLYRGDQVTLGDVRQLVVPNPNSKANRKNLFSRAPLVADLRVAGPDGSAQDLTLVANHFKSHYSPSGAPTEGQRVLEAKAVKSLVRELRQSDPERPVMVLGDLNDGVGTKTLETLVGGSKRPLLHDVTAQLIPQGERYSFIFRGERNLLDHVLTTGDLASRAVFAGAKHINVDLAESTTWGSLPYGASDHDPVYVDFALGTSGPQDAAAGARQLPHPR